MNREDLFEGFCALDDDLLKRSECGGNAMKKRKSIGRAIKYGSIAAGLAAAVGTGIFFVNDKMPKPDENPKDNLAAETNDSDTRTNWQEETESYVDAAMLLASDEHVEAQALELRCISMEGYSARYCKVASVESDILKVSVGNEVKGTENGYKLSGHKDMQYLIFKDNEEYSLWKFSSLEEEGYAYQEVLQSIYNIHSAGDITEIIVSPADMDNTEEGKEIQKEIGTIYVTEDKEIEALYEVLSGLTCYGDNHWEEIGLGDDLPSSMQNQTRAGRYLTLVTTQGIEVDTLKYTGISGMFYEYGGIAYQALTPEEKSTVEEILSIEPIEKGDEAASEPANIRKAHADRENAGTESETGNKTADAPADETAYKEAKTYDTELTDLQNRISQAMMNNELPFVISSAILENPDRLHVVVTTKDADSMAKLEAYDTTGSLLEIEYSENVIVLE